MATEAWLRGTVPDVLPELVPAAHMLLQAAEELSAAAQGLSSTELWARPGGAASVGFHLRHIAGAADRLLTYARGEQLNDAQRVSLASEAQPDSGSAVTTLLEAVRVAIDESLFVLRGTTRAELFLPRAVGRAQLPTNVIGLLYHVAEHTVRHTGQVIATARAVRA